MRLDLPIPILAVLLLVGAGLAVSWIGYRRLRRVLPRRYRIGLLVLRATLLLLLGLLLLAPYHERQRPDPAAFRMVILVDASGSMRVRDIDGNRSRLELVREWLTATSDASPIQALRSRFQTETYLVTDRSVRYTGGDFGILPGATALGDALAEAAAGYGTQPLGAVLMISDGHSNTGRSPIEEAKRYAAHGIPISCIGVGSPGVPADLALRVPDETIQTDRDRAAVINAIAVNTFDQPHQARIELRRGDLLIDSRTLTLEPGGVEQPVSFTVTPEMAGTHVYRLLLNADLPDSIPETDIAHVAVEVGDPDTFTMLYLGAHLGWEHPFLRHTTRHDDQITLSAILRLAPDIYRGYGQAFEEEEHLAGFPDAFEAYSRFDAVILDSRAVTLLSDEALDALRHFVAVRGGGLLYLGPFQGLDDPLYDLLPVADVRAERSAGRRYLTPDTEVLFPVRRAAALSAPPGPFLPSDSPHYVITEMKRGARSAMTLGADETPVLAVQRYGSGRSAYLGIEQTWSWHLASQADAERHRAFWSHLLAWLGSTGKPRLRLPFDGARLDLDQPARLTAEILGSDFLPAPEAEIHAGIRGPDGKLTERTFAPGGEAPGEFDDLYTPSLAGEYRVDVRVRLPDGETLEEDAFFLAVPGGIEMQNVEKREDLLRDIARISGGDYRAYHRVEPGFMPAVADSVPLRSETVRWSESWFLLVFLAGTAAAEWYVRRRIGLV